MNRTGLLKNRTTWTKGRGCNEERWRKGLKGRNGERDKRGEKEGGSRGREIWRKELKWRGCKGYKQRSYNEHPYQWKFVCGTKF